MLDPTILRDHLDEVGRGLRNRGLDPDKTLADIAALELVRRQLIQEAEELKRQQNAAGPDIAKAKRQGLDTAALQEAGRARAQQIKQLDARLEAIELQRNSALQVLPNLPHASVPVGAGAADNVEVRRHGAPRRFDFDPVPHWDLGPALGIIDFERGTRLSGARFTVLSGAGARLSRALINFMLDLHTQEHGYREVEPPFLVNSASLLGTGNLPKFEADLFKIAGDWDLYLIPTAEVPLTNLHRSRFLGGRVPSLHRLHRAERGLHGRMCGGPAAHQRSSS
jgi:seryl-tRNA synthetase